MREWEYLVAGLVVFVLALIIWRRGRRIKFLKELLRRQNERSFKNYNEIVSVLTKNFATGPTPTLADLASDTETSYELK